MPPPPEGGASKEKSFQAVQLLGVSGQKKAVKPIIDSLKVIDSLKEYRSHSNYIIHANQALARLTGRYHYGNDPQWWEKNKDKTRLQWLKDAMNHPSTHWNYWPAFVAAQELSKLGDDTGVPILLQQLSSRTEIKRRIEALTALHKAYRDGSIALDKF